ncbi:pectin lyase fold/virulence factor [Vibrio phage 1.239.O._10N.261.52.F6]|nr:pectin lyase fold/virulence factor [Vibrio phage 1.239.O._10N.261.52.F6]
MSCSDFPTIQTAKTFKLDAETQNEVVTSDNDRTSPASDGKTKLTLKGFENQVDTLIAEGSQEITDAIENTIGKSYIGTWTQGVTTFATMNEYSDFNGITYKPKSGVTLPYTAQTSDPTTAPDNASVEPFSDVNTANLLQSVNLIADDIDVTADGGLVKRDISSRLNDELRAEDFGLVADWVSTGVGTDNSDALIDLIYYAKTNNIKVINFGSGTYRFTKSIVIETSGLQLVGQGMTSTILRFEPVSSDEVFFDLIGTSTNTAIRSMQLTEGNARTGTCVRISDDRSYAGANWKNSFTDVRIDGFKTGLWLWSEDQSDTNEQTHSSETTLLHCKIKNCLTGIRFSNIQSVNTTLVSTDIENDVSGENYTMVYDESGADFKVFGGSWIGKGRVYHGVINPAYSISWSGGNIAFYQTRFELRGDATDPVLAFPATSSSAFMNFIMNDTLMVNSTAGRSLCDFSSPVQVALTRASVLVAPLALHQYPSVGSTAVNGTDGLQSRGSFLIKDSSNILYQLETTAAPGFTYNQTYSCPVRIENNQGYTNGNHLRDSLFFNYQRTPESGTIGAGPALVSEKHFVKHNESESADVGNFPLKLPHGTTPTKLTVLKHPLVRSNANVVTWYLVKDADAWVNPLTFDVATDAITMGTVDLTGKSGYYEVDIDWTSTYLDRAFRSGDSKWLEGRMYITYSSILTGFLGVKYI